MKEYSDGSREPRTALVTGFTGQDGTFLTAQLLSKGYKVIGLTRRVSTEPPGRVRGSFDFRADITAGRLVLETGDLLSITSLMRIIGRWRPDEVYNLAAQSHVGVSFKQPEFTMASILEGTVNLITALESFPYPYYWRMYQASTSEMFGGDHGEPQGEETEFNPKSPYAIAKAAAHYYCRMKRNQGQFISAGILFNHESEIRGGDFVTQKIVRSLVQRELDQTTVLELGNLEARRDWGYAGDYVDAMWRMLQVDKADDFVVASGASHSVREFVELVAMESGLHRVEWSGEGLDEIGLINGQVAIRVKPEFYRPNEVPALIGDATKAKNQLQWSPRTTFEEMVKLMVKSEMQNHGR